jgi:hypothetical protein
MHIPAGTTIISLIESKLNRFFMTICWKDEKGEL